MRIGFASPAMVVGSGAFERKIFREDHLAFHEAGAMLRPRVIVGMNVRRDGSMGEHAERAKKGRARFGW